jgi:L-lactate dehydrogenase (cytochrome)
MLDSLQSVLRFQPLASDRVARRLSRAASVSDLRRIARSQLPRGVFDYVDGAAEDELTMRRNAAAYRRLQFRPRVLRDVGMIDTSTTLLGRPLAYPLVLAPTGFTRMVDPEGELAVARAADRADLPYTLSTMGTRSIEEIAAVSSGRKWFQVYVWRDRALVKDMLDRAATAGYEAIVITVDVPVLGRRERDIRRGFTLPPRIGLDTIIDGIIHPEWTLRLMRAEPIEFSNVFRRDGVTSTSPVSLAEHVNSQFDPHLSWDDIGWFRANWTGPIVIKGIQTVEDARMAADVGVEAIAISNHGGRQLDGAPPPLELVAPVADSVGDRIEIICDGGVRRASDILKAVALGARACMAGRAYLYALGAGGERGVDFVLSLFRSDLKRTMALLGVTTIRDVTSDLVEWRTPIARNARAIDPVT